MTDSAEFFPIPDIAREMLERSQSGNFSLIFPRLTAWKIEKNSIKPSETSVESLYKKANVLMGGLSECLKRVQRRQEKLLNDVKELKFFKTLTIYGALVSPLISGLGAGHPTERGMILDRNTGCPFLPASSIKGVLRAAYAVSLARDLKKNSVEDVLLSRFFGGKCEKYGGSDTARGQIVFLDAFPVNPPKLKLDIMNPHYPKYYNKEILLPTEQSDPVPLKFMAVDKGLVFAFRCYFDPLASDKFQNNRIAEKDVSKIKEAFEIAFSELGFGGKTAVGYGRFKEIDKEEAQTTSSALALLEKGQIYEGVFTIVKGKLKIKLTDSAIGHFIGEQPKGEEGAKARVKIVVANSATSYNVRLMD